MENLEEERMGAVEMVMKQMEKEKIQLFFKKLTFLLY